MAGILVPPFKLSSSTTIVPRTTGVTTIIGNTGGLTIKGGTAASDNLTLEPSSASNYTGAVIVGAGAGDYGTTNASGISLWPNGFSIAGNSLGASGISFAGTISQTSDSYLGAFPVIALFSDSHTHKPSSASVVVLPLANTFYAINTILNDTSGNVVAGGAVGLFVRPTINKTSSGTLTVTQVYGVYANAIVTAGTLTTFTALIAVDPTGAGTLANSVIVDVPDLTKATTLNIALRSAITSGTGKWNILTTGSGASAHKGNFRFGDNTAPDHGIHLASSLGIKRTQIADATATVASTDAVISYTSLTAGRAVNLQAVATSKTDKFLFIKDEVGKSGDFNLTVTPSGSELIDGIATIKLKQDYTSMLLYNNGTNWSTLIPPNQVCLLDRDDSITTVGPSSTVETTVYSYTVLANTIGKHKTIRYVIQGHMGNSTGSNQTMRIRVKFGATVVYDATHTAPTAATERVFYVMGYISATNSASAQEGTAVSFLGAANTVTGVGAQVQETFCAHYHNMTEATTADKTLAITLQLGASNANLQAETHTTQVEIY